MSEIRATTISDTAGTGPVTLTGQYAAKVWANFNGSGTAAIRESGNVSSLTDNSVGVFTLNFTSALVDANYAPSGVCGETGGTEVWEVQSRASSTLQIAGYQTETGGNKDSVLFSVTVTR